VAKKWDVTGDPTEGCLLTLAKKGGVDSKKLEKKMRRKEELVFDSDRKRMSTINGNTMFTKGAPDSLLEICTHIQINGKTVKLTDAKKREIMARNDKLAEQAYRVLGFAYKKLSHKNSH